MAPPESPCREAEAELLEFSGLFPLPRSPISQPSAPPEQDPRQAEPAARCPLPAGGTGAGAHRAALTPSRADRTPTRRRRQLWLTGT